MTPLIAITLFLNIFISIREFFAIWDHIDNQSLSGKTPCPDDYMELVISGSLGLLTFFTFCYLCFR
jgi:hypothetical protein